MSAPSLPVAFQDPWGADLLAVLTDLRTKADALQTQITAVTAGLGTAAHVDGTTFATAAQGVSADSALTTANANTSAISAMGALLIPKTALTTDGSILTRAAGVPAQVTRAALAADTAFSSLYTPPATGPETIAGVIATKAVTPAGLTSSIPNITFPSLAALKFVIPVPAGSGNFTIADTAGTTWAQYVSANGWLQLNGALIVPGNDTDTNSAKLTLGSSSRTNGAGAQIFMYAPTTPINGINQVQWVRGGVFSWLQYDAGGANMIFRDNVNAVNALTFYPGAGITGRVSVGGTLDVTGAKVTVGLAASAPQLLSGAGAPALAAPVGSLYMRTDGASGTSLYYKETGVSTTGWVAAPTSVSPLFTSAVRVLGTAATPGSTTLTIGNTGTGADADLLLNAPAGQVNQIRFQRAGASAWWLYDANSTNLYIRDMVNSVMALSLNPGAGTTGQAVFAGTVQVPTKLVLGASISTSPVLTSGAGSPESVVTAPIGSLYMRTDGVAAGTCYVKETGTGNTGWTPVGPTVPNVQEFTASNTWTKPTGPFTRCDVTITGAGAGGASGRRGAAGTVRGGGAGGSGGQVVERSFPFSAMPASLTATCYVGGVGGLAVTTDDTNGNGGAAPSFTSLIGTGFYLAAAGGGGGGPGTTVGGTQGGTTLGGPNIGVSVGGAGGIGAATPSILSNLLMAGSAPGGGVGGAGISAANSTAAGGTQGSSPVSPLGSNGAAGADGGGAGGDALQVPGQPYGGHAGGGGSSNTSASGAGGAGVRGAGGGGGAASLNGFASGAGGKGGDGVIKIVCS